MSGFICRFLVLGKRWNLVRKTLSINPETGKRWHGACDHPDKANKCVFIDTAMKGQNELDTIIHEVLHAAAWSVLDEDFVADTAEDLSRLLWKLGYRKAGSNDESSD